MSASPPLPRLGVVIVAFNSADVILDCLETLLASTTPLHIAVVNNASPDNTVDLIRAWAAGTHPYDIPDDIPFPVTPRPKPLSLVETEAGARLSLGALGDITLVQAGVNAGFAAGVNRGLELFAAIPEIDAFWVVNPDCVLPPATAAALAEEATKGDYALIGTRVCYTDPPGQIQIDGGTLNPWTGVTGNLNLGRQNEETPRPADEALDFIMGASMLVSRPFYDRVGGMVEDYFLYYEEVDWALRRGTLPLRHAKEALVYHRAGTSIGSPTLARFASPFSLYFKHRGRMRFTRRFNPLGLPVAYAYGLAKAAQMLSKGALPEAKATLLALHGLAPPKEIAEKLSPEARAVAFGHRPPKNAAKVT